MESVKNNNTSIAEDTDVGTENIGKVLVSEIFGPTFQGEGALIGTPTFFIRTAACDYKNICKQCDTQFAVDPKLYKHDGKTRKMTCDEIADETLALMQNTKVEWVTISGGNPALWDLAQLVKRLQTAGKKVAVETQGSKYQPWLARCDLVTVSPKGPGMGATVIESLGTLQLFMHALVAQMTRIDWDERVILKIPVFDKDDLYFAKSVRTFYPSLRLFLSTGNDIIGLKSLAKAKYDDSAHVIQLLDLVERYEAIVNLIWSDFPQLQNCTVLPQLHVLIYGNRQGV